MKWRNISVLEHDIKRGNKTVIKAGTKNVKVAFRSASWTFENENGELQRGNLYKYRGKIY